MQKIDLKKDLKHLYQPSAREVVQLEVPSANFLMINGKGDPNSAQEYADAVEALFSVAYAIKFAVKKSPLAIDYGVMPLEGLWWADDMSKFGTEDKSNWLWTMMIAQPLFVTGAMVGQAIADVKNKKTPQQFPDCALKVMPKVSARRSCTSAPSVRKARLLPKCTISLQPVAANCAANIMKSI